MSRLIDADTIITALLYDEEHEETQEVKMSIADFLDSHTVEECPQNGGWINNYEWICPTCGSSILIKTSKQSKAIGMKLSVCPVCGKEILYGKAD